VVNPNTGIVEREKNPTPLYITLAHELIHADHYTRGVAIPTRTDFGKPNTGIYWIQTGGTEKNPLMQRKEAPKEELATIGIIKRAGDITENDIRKEHGLWLRGVY
jgi:hypothetical protein